MSAEENIQLVRDFFARMSAGGPEAIRPLLHEEATWTVTAKSIPGSGSHHGHKGILEEFLGPFQGVFKEGPVIEIRTIISQGDLVACETHGTGTFQDGRPYDNNYCWMIEVKDGKVYHLKEYMDSHYVMSLGG